MSDEDFRCSSRNI